MSCLLEFENVSIDIARARVLNAVTFSVKSGDSIAIVGKNGCGKSSLLKGLIGSLKISSGEIRCLDRRLRDIAIRERASIFGYVPQTFTQSLPVSVFDFVLMSCLSKNGFADPTDRDVCAAEQALDFFSARFLSKRSIQEISGGERQKVLLAAAIAHTPQILLLDEPSAFLDPLAQIELLEGLRALTSSGRYAILAVTHDVSRLTEWSERTLGFSDGRLVFDGPSHELKDSKIYDYIFPRAVSCAAVDLPVS